MDIGSLAELGVATLALIVVVIIAYTILNRSKSDTRVIKVFADMVSGSIRDISEGVKVHGDQSVTRHGEVVLAFQTLHPLFLQLINNSTEILKVVKEVKQSGGQIRPAIDTLAQQLETQKGSVDKMNDTVSNQNQDIKKILATLVRLESKVTAISNKFDHLGVEIQSTKTELNDIKTDVSKLKPTGEAPEVKSETKQESKS